jgi:kynureninase
LRGSQISFTHADGGYAIVQALIAVGVIGDFRSPNIMRFGFAPLYIGFADVWHAVDKLATILKTNSWQKPEFQNRKTVT